VKKIILLFGLAVVTLVVLFSGCITPNQLVCGNGICESAENYQNCPQDCNQPQTQYHSECQNQQCVQVEGVGPNQCASNIDCSSPNPCNSNGICESPQENEQKCPQDCSPINPTPTCAQQGGITCENYQVCNGQVKTGSDTDQCCIGECQPNGFLSEQIVREKMVWNLPELSGFTYRGRADEFDLYTQIDLRYISTKDNDQHSEFMLNIYANALQDSFLDDQVNQQKVLWDLSLREISGNKIFEGVKGTQRTVFWISGENFINGWNGNDIGSITDDALFETLTKEYLKKYPSTYQQS